MMTSAIALISGSMASTVNLVPLRLRLADEPISGEFLESSAA